jgi:hypothetical protein
MLAEPSQLLSHSPNGSLSERAVPHFHRVSAGVDGAFVTRTGGGAVTETS